jgi:3-mercaptopyruvate sulfurtransferase SseA
VLAFALELSGAKNVGLYDGSWAEYAQQPGVAIATGDSRSPPQADMVI